MKNKFAVFVLALSFAAADALAQAPVSPAVGGPSAGQIGIIAAVRGTVEIAKEGQVGQVAGSGAPVYLGDEIRTDENSTLQILLLDETLFTVGPNSRIVIDEFVYDPRNGEGAVSAQAVEGVFRFVTGKIARKRPEKMKVGVPGGTVGVRGTIFGLEIREGKSLGVLLGPGSQHNTPHREGSLIIQAGNNQTLISRASYGAELGANGELSGAFRVPDAVIQRLTAGLGAALPPANQDGEGGGSEDGEGGDGEGEGSGGGSATETSGQSTAGASQSLGGLSVVTNTTQSLDAEASEASRDAVADSARGIMDGISYLEDLRTVETGQFHYAESGVELSGGSTGDAYDIQFDIDFGARKVGGGFSQITADLPSSVGGNVEFKIPSRDFGSGSGPAIFVYEALPQESGGSCAIGTCIADVIIALNNEGTNVATTMTHVVTITEDSGEGPDSTTGAGIAERLDGLSSDPGFGV